MSSQSVANTILRHLGGKYFIAMTGAKNFVGGNNSLQFSFPKCRNTNKCRIILNKNDTYDVEFFKYNRKKCSCLHISTHSAVYAEQLREVFENTTNLKTIL